MRASTGSMLESLQRSADQLSAMSAASAADGNAAAGHSMWDLTSKLSDKLQASPLPATPALHAAS
jgi:hypothetical protein